MVWQEEFFKEQRGSSLMVQWLRLHAFPQGLLVQSLAGN